MGHPTDGAVADPANAALARRLPAEVDLRLVVTDMDGTLLDGEGRLPCRLGEVLERMRAAGVIFAPASGRQMANLRRTFGSLIQDAPVIAENGTFAMLGEQDLYRNVIARSNVEPVISTVRALADRGVDVGVVLATPHRAWIERTDQRFRDQVSIYYSANAVVGDLLDLPLDDVVKIAVHDFGEAETDSYPVLAASSPALQTVLSGHHWTDLMAPDASKGLALAAVQRELGISPAQTAAFGDYLNDLDLFDHAGLSFAMANAHPRLRQAARFLAPANTEDGVLRTIELLLDRVVS